MGTTEPEEVDDDADAFLATGAVKAEADALVPTAGDDEDCLNFFGRYAEGGGGVGRATTTCARKSIGQLIQGSDERDRV